MIALYEVLRQTSSLPTPAAKIEFLRKHDSVPLRRILRYAFDSRVKWLLPEGDPPYTPLPKHEMVGSEAMLLKEIRTCYLFLMGDDDFNANIPQAKREQKFVELLEACHPEDSALLLAAKNRRLPYPDISPELIKEAFPGLLA